MTANADVVKLPAKDSALIDYFIKAGEFKSKNEFIIYAVKKAVNEVVLKELEEKSSTGGEGAGEARGGVHKISEDQGPESRDINRLSLIDGRELGRSIQGALGWRGPDNRRFRGQLCSSRACSCGGYEANRWTCMHTL